MLLYRAKLIVRRVQLSWFLKAAPRKVLKYPSVWCISNFGTYLTLILGAWLECLGNTAFIVLMWFPYYYVCSFGWFFHHLPCYSRCLCYFQFINNAIFTFHFVVLLLLGSLPILPMPHLEYSRLTYHDFHFHVFLDILDLKQLKWLFWFVGRYWVSIEKSSIVPTYNYGTFSFFTGVSHLKHP